MCDRPISDENGNTFACQRCNACIAARKSDWVSRSMAEKAYMGHAMCMMLSYRDNPDGTMPDSARAFKYKDVQDFIDLIRKRYVRHYGKSERDHRYDNDISYIVAGELGSNTKRVHWHIVLFSKRPLPQLGKWASFRSLLPDFVKNLLPAPKITRKGVNQFWELWPHGFVCPQIPDQGGMSYVLKYALKDQFNVVKAKGTKRFTKSERHASGMFRMSKKPMIGQRYLQQQLVRWWERGAVPPTLEIKVPDQSGFWWPKGKLRTWLLACLANLNSHIERQAGRPAPQWDALLHSVENAEADLDGLLNNPDERRPYVPWKFRQKTARIPIPTPQQSREERQRAYRIEDTKRRCGHSRVCRRCWIKHTGPDKDTFGYLPERSDSARASEAAIRAHNRDARAAWRASGKYEPFHIWYRRQRPDGNPFCLDKGSDRHNEAFGA